MTGAVFECRCGGLDTRARAGRSECQANFESGTRSVSKIEMCKRGVTLTDGAPNDVTGDVITRWCDSCKAGAR